jgi:hypothetical protein
MKLSILHPDIWYFEDAIPETKKFLSLLEDNKNITSVIPDWSTWLDSFARGTDEIIINKPLAAGEGGAPMGVDKFVDWDMSINDYGRIWPRIAPDSEVHKKAYETLKLIDVPFKKVLDYYWSENTELPKLEYISKNYLIRKYSTGTSMPVHVDASGRAGSVEDDKISMDLAALIYLNDDYTGGELNFIDLGIKFKPSAGSVVIFDGMKHQHESTLITSGNKIYIPFYIHTEYGLVSCFREPVEAGGNQTFISNQIKIK